MVVIVNEFVYCLLRHSMYRRLVDVADTECRFAFLCFDRWLLLLEKDVWLIERFMFLYVYVYLFFRKIM